VVLGEHTLAENPDCLELENYCNPAIQTIEVEDVTIHEKYNPRAPTLGYDIALVRLKYLAILSYVSHFLNFKMLISHQC
jgi:hypothetical protein